jgi:transposase
VIDRSVLADWMGRTGALIAPVVDHMATTLKQGSSRPYVAETTAPVLDPGRGKTKTGYLWAVLHDDRGWNGPAPPGVVFHYRPGRTGEYADEILTGFEGTIQVDAYAGYSHLTKPVRKGGKPLQLAFCWAHGRRKLIAARPKKGSPIVDEALLRVAALYKVENAIRSPVMNRRNALFAGHDEGGRNWARFASLIATCKMSGVEPYAYLHDLFIKLANGHLANDIDALMPWAYAPTAITSQ